MTTQVAAGHSYALLADGATAEIRRPVLTTSTR